VQADAGEVLYEGVRVKGPEEKLIPGHPRIAYLSQYYELRNHYRVEELMDMASNVDAKEANALFEVCRVSHLLKRKTDQLSGGEKQRIALARVLITKPGLLILDEPFSNLDPIHKTVLKGVLSDIGAQLQLTCLLASHDPLDTLSWADSMIVLRHGRVVQEGAPGELYRQPANEYVAGLLGKYTLIGAGKDEAFREAIGIGGADKDLLIRPEDVRITKEGSGSVSGVIEEVRFMGSYNELEVRVAGVRLLVMSLDGDMGIGDVVAVSYMGN
jgi:ABC-type Fe3+/spermidine/putrescine transport system ATPase subunit